MVLLMEKAETEFRLSIKGLLTMVLGKYMYKTLCTEKENISPNICI